MITRSLVSKLFRKTGQSCTAILCSALLAPGDGIWAVQAQQQGTGSAQQQTSGAGQQDAGKLPADQLDSLVAPIALYPDPMLAQVLAASTYPLEIIQLQQWLTKNKELKDKALVDAVSKQPWDPSVQGLAALPDVVNRLANDIQWTTDLGNAFLAQQPDVMDAVQRMRKKAKDAGNLKSTEQQKVETKTVESKQVIVVEQANPQVIYVPTYNPTVVYGPPVYPYPPIVYPPPPPPGAYVAGMAVAFGVGVAMGAAWHGGWGYGCGWGHNDVTINVNNNFNRNTNVSGGNRVNTGGGSWQHNPQHRGAAPYSDRSTANKYGGTSRGASASDRQAKARQNQASTANRGQSGARPSQGQTGGQQSRSNDRSSGGPNRPSSTTTGGGNRTPSTSASSKNTALGGGSSGKSGSSAKASSSRGNSSMGSRSSSGGGGRKR